MNKYHSPKERKTFSEWLSNTLSGIVIVILTTIVIGGFVFIIETSARESVQGENDEYFEEYIESHTVEYNQLKSLSIRIDENQKHMMRQLDRIIEKLYPN